MISTSRASAEIVSGPAAVEFDGDGPLGGLGGDSLDSRRGRGGQVDLGQLAILLARFDLREVQQVGDQFPHAVHARQAADDHFIVGGQVVAQLMRLQHVEVAGHGIQGGLELVAQHANELETDAALFLGEPAGLLGQDQPRGRLANRALELVGRERLGKEIVGPALGRGHGGLDRGVGRNHDRQHVALASGEAIEHFQPADARHLVVQQEDVGRIAVDLLQRLLARLGLVDGKGHRAVDVGHAHGEIAERASHAQPHAHFVVGHQDLQGIHVRTMLSPQGGME